MQMKVSDWKATVNSPTKIGNLKLLQSEMLRSRDWHLTEIKLVDPGQ